MNEFKQIVQTVRRKSPILYFILLIHLLMIIGALIGLLTDDRTLMGVNVWIKPLKFSISTGVYILTVGYLTTLYPFSNVKRHIINHLVAWTLLLEIVIVFYQASRGVQSHYNTSTSFDGILFAMMGILIAINVLIMIWFIIETVRLKVKVEPTVRWGLLIGWIIVFFGSWVGSQMIDQMSHNVGVADGGEGLPLLNWSTVAGDLRVAHFFGLHAIQIIPIFAYFLHKQTKLTFKSRLLIVLSFGIVYAAFISFVYYQASQGKPFLSL